jgi:hypothetical protein
MSELTDFVKKVHPYDEPEVRGLYPRLQFAQVILSEMQLSLVRAGLRTTGCSTNRRKL